MKKGSVFPIVYNMIRNDSADGSVKYYILKHCLKSCWIAFPYGGSAGTC